MLPGTHRERKDPSMNADIKRFSRALSFMAVLGWVADTCGSVALHRGWWILMPVFNTVSTVVLAIALHQALKRA